MKVFSTARINGSYDFFTGIITLDRFNKSDVDLVNRALDKIPPPVIDEDSNNLRDIRALVKHEITHFLDHVTTLWGLEFLGRRNLFIKAIENNQSDVNARAKVYSLNSIELEMHSDLVIIHKEVSFDQCDLAKHQLKYDGKYGAFIIIKLFQGEDLVCDIPLSMLSLLEANAIANEYLSRFDDLAGMSQHVLNTAEAAVERRLQKILNEPSLSEYSVLIRLAKIHFPFLDSRQLLEYISALASFCLNLTQFSMATINEEIRHSFEDTYKGNGIWADLCRASSRHVVAFKTILFMYSWIDSAPHRLKQGHIGLMKIDPYGAIEKFWSGDGRESDFSSEFERDLLKQSLLTVGGNEVIDFIEKTIEKNQKWMEQRNLRKCSFDEIGCIDILLKDQSVIRLPQRIDFDTLDHAFGILDTYMAASDLLEKNYEKIHMSLDEAEYWLEANLQMKEAGFSGFSTWNGSLSGTD